MLDIPTNIRQQEYKEADEGLRKSDTSTFSYWKAASLAAVAAASAYGVGYAVCQYFYVSSSVSPSYFGAFSAALAVLLIAFFLSVLFINRKALLIAESLLIMLAMGVSFIGAFSIRPLIGAGVMLLLLVWGALAGRREIEASIKIRFIRTLGVVVSKATLGLAILLAAMFYDVFLTKPLDEHNILFPRQLFESSQGIVSKLLSPVMGNIDTSLSTRSMAEYSVDQAINEDRAVKRAVAQDPGLRQQFIDKSVGEIQKNFESIFGAKIDPTQKISVALYDALIGKFNAMTPEQRSGIVLGMAVLFAFAVQAASVVLRLLLIPIAFVIYEICIMARFAKVSFENENKEVITLP
jgi:hypothetical protein